jgi:predicted nucleic acid-binding protein
VLSSIGLTALVHGIYRAQSAAALSRRDSFIRELLNVVEVYPYTNETAMLAGKIDGEEQGRGIPVPFSDLLIGATALEVDYSPLTVNVWHFRLIPSVTVVQL